MKVRVLMFSLMIIAMLLYTTCMPICCYYLSNVCNTYQYCIKFLCSLKIYHYLYSFDFNSLIELSL